MSDDELPSWIYAPNSPGMIVGGSGHSIEQHFHAPPREPVNWPVRRGTPPAPAVCLQSRRPEMATLRHCLAATGHGSGVTSAAAAMIVGLGGVGKSQLAAEYHRLWCTGPGAAGLTVWAGAATRLDVVTAYADAAAAVNEPGDPPIPEDPEEAARSFVAWAQSTEHPWLVVLDDLGDPRDLIGLWPTGPRGATLVTTRRADAAPRVARHQVIDLGTFTPGQSRTYLEAKLDDPTLLDDADGLAADVAHLPLALSQAAAFVVMHGSSETCRTYRARFAARRADLASLFPDTTLTDSYRLTVATTWKISVDAADATEPVGLARPLLELAGLLDAQGFPVDVLTATSSRHYLTGHRVAGRDTPSPGVDECRDALTVLEWFSLADVGARRAGDDAGAARAVRVHALVQRFSRENTADPAAAGRAAADALVEAWTEDPRRPGTGQALRDCTTALAGHARPYLWNLAAHPVLIRAGRSLDESGRAGAARDYWGRLAADADELLGPRNPLVLAIRGNHAQQRGEAGDPVGAAAELTGLLDRVSREAGRQHPVTVVLRSNLAHLHGMAGDVAGAAAEYADLLPDAERILGPEHEGTLAIRGNLARWRAEAGDTSGGVIAHEELVADLERLRGHDHPDTLFARLNLVSARGNAGDPAVAAADCARLLDEMLTTFGPDHPTTLTTRGILATELGLAGDFADAAAALRTLLDDNLRVRGPDHPGTLNVRGRIAYMRGQAGDPAAAARDLDELLRDQLHVLGADHPDTLLTRWYLAYMRAEAGDVGGATDAYRTLLDHQLRILGPDHRGTLSTRNEIVRLRLRAGDATGAMAGFGDLLRDTSRVLGDDHPDALRTLGNALHSMTWSEASPEMLAQVVVAYDALLVRLERVMGPHHPNTLHTRYNRSATLGRAGDTTGAMREFARLARDNRRAHGADHPDTLTARGESATWRGRDGDPAGAAAELTLLLADMRRALGPDHPSTLTTRNNLAGMRVEAGDRAGAVAEFTEVVRECVRLLGADHPDTLASRGYLANCHGFAGDPGRAVAEYTELLRDRRRVLGPLHAQTLTAEANLEGWRRKVGPDTPSS